MNDSTTVRTDSKSGLVDEKVGIRTVLAFLWICHFVLWIFGDMFTLLQGMAEPVTDTFIQFVAKQIFGTHAIAEDKRLADLKT